MKKAESPSKWVENTVGKGEIVRDEKFLFSLSVFERHVLQTRKKPRIVWERTKVLSLLNLYLHSAHINTLHSTRKSLMIKEIADYIKFFKGHCEHR